MESKRILKDGLQNILNSLSQCKTNYLREKEECMRIREINAKLEIELKEARELEKSHRYHLLSSREMIGNLQETISDLVYLKRDMKKLKEELSSKDSTILAMEKEKENIIRRHNENIIELQNKYASQMEEAATIHERNIQQVHHDSETQIAQVTCVVEELRAKIKDMDAEHRDKMNVVVLEYEEKLQRSAAQITQLHDQHARTDANIGAYRRRLEDLEEKLKQSQFKQYLAQSTLPSQFENQVERPYSVNRDHDDSVDSDPVLCVPKKPAPVATTNRGVKQNTLQITYYGNNKPPVSKTENKGLFKIVKKRKLYNDKDFQDF